MDYTYAITKAALEIPQDEFVSTDTFWFHVIQTAALLEHTERKLAAQVQNNLRLEVEIQRLYEGMEEGASGNLSVPEPQPLPSSGPDLWALVVKDMVERHESGLRKYGTPLRADNGRKPLIDLYQELLDAVVYTRQAIEEQR